MRFENLRNKFLLQHDKRECTRPTRKRKPWSQIKSDRTKQQRLNECGHLVHNTIKQNVPQCKLAQLSLCLGKKKFNTPGSHNK